MVGRAYDEATIGGVRLWLRRSRLDELPQLWNIFRGDMSWVGPRPPDRRYVNKHSDVYGRVMRSRPGLTGLATLTLFRWESKVLRSASTLKNRETVYGQRVVPRKARLDLIYQQRQTGRWIILFDAMILVRTAVSLLLKDSKKATGSNRILQTSITKSPNGGICAKCAANALPEPVS